MGWSFKGKLARPGQMRYPGFVLDEKFKKWMNFLLPQLVNKDLVVTIEFPAKKAKKASKKVKKKATRKKKSE